MKRAIFSRNAFANIAPVSALIHLCNREPEKMDEALEWIEAFCRHFARMKQTESYTCL